MDFTSFYTQLNEWKATAKSMLEKHKQRLDALDWDNVMEEMVYDDDYTPYDMTDFKEFYPLVSHIRKFLTEDTTHLRDLLLETEALVHSVGTFQFNRLKAEVQKRSIDDVPT
jgi:hypothetical protein